MPFVCPSCGTQDRYGLLTEMSSGRKSWCCNGSHKNEVGRAVRSCDWSCAESEGLKYGCVSLREVLLQVAHTATTTATTISQRALGAHDNLRTFLGDAAEAFENLSDQLRVVEAFLREQEEQAERAARGDGAR